MMEDMLKQIKSMLATNANISASEAVTLYTATRTKHYLVSKLDLDTRIDSTASVFRALWGLIKQAHKLVTYFGEIKST